MNSSISPSHEWQLQEAKNKFSQVVNLALHEGPQVITLRGKKTAVLISIEEYLRLTCPPGTLSQFFRQSPLMDSGIDLKRDKEEGGDIDL